MKAYLDRDGRKTNTINIPQSENGTCKKNGMDMCIDAKCSECETKKMGIEYRTIQFLIPVHELTLDTGAYAKWSEWDVTPKDRMSVSVDDETEYVTPKALVNVLNTVTTMLLDLLKDCEKEPDLEEGKK